LLRCGERFLTGFPRLSGSDGAVSQALCGSSGEWCPIYRLRDKTPFILTKPFSILSKNNNLGRIVNLVLLKKQKSLYQAPLSKFLHPLIY